MKTIRELIHKKQHTKSPEAPDINSQETIDVTHILFFSPKLNATGYYRMLTPYLELAKTPFFKTHVLGISKEDFNAPFELAKVPLLDDWVLWADYMVFPTLTKDFMYFFKACKVINPELQIVIDVEFVLHALPPSDPLYKKTTKEMLTTFGDNLNRADIITSHNEHILDFYEDFLEKQYGNRTTFFALVPNLVSSIGYEEIRPFVPEDKAKVRIGILTDQRYPKDLEQLVVPLQSIQEKYKDKVTIVVFGWNGVLQDGSTPLETLAIEYHKPVPFIHHLEKLSSLHLDLALLPIQNKASRRFALDTSYLELASLGIPVIASRNSIYNEYIIDDTTGNLVQGADEWQDTIAKHIESEPYRTTLGKAAKEHIWDTYSYTDENIQLFTELYF